jgi:hypothetical protein
MINILKHITKEIKMPIRNYPIEKIKKTVFENIQKSEKGVLRGGPWEIYNPYRKELYGYGSQSYSGNVWSYEMVKRALATVKTVLPESTVKMTYKIEYAGQQYGPNELGIFGHSYVCVDNGNLIVDPLYRDLLILRRGYVTKNTSPYADYLFNLDPVFVGTTEEMEIIINNCNKEKLKDPEHKDDTYGNTARWFKEPSKSYSFY